MMKQIFLLGHLMTARKLKILPKNCQTFYKFIDGFAEIFKEILSIIQHFSAKPNTILWCISLFVQKNSHFFIRHFHFPSSYDNQSEIEN